MDLREHGGHALRRRRRCGQEAQRAVVLLLVRAVGDQAVQVNVEAEVAAELRVGGGSELQGHHLPRGHRGNKAQRVGPRWPPTIACPA